MPVLGTKQGGNGQLSSKRGEHCECKVQKSGRGAKSIVEGFEDRFCQVGNKISKDVRGPYP